MRPWPNISPESEPGVHLSSSRWYRLAAVAGPARLGSWGVRHHSHIKNNTTKKSMKTKSIIIVSVAIALAVGFLAGRFQASMSWSRLYSHYAYRTCATDVGIYAKVLADLRGGQQSDAMSFLEQSLDSGLSGLDQLPRENWTPAIRAAVTKARDYRVTHPWDKTQQQIGPSVQRSLDSVK